MAILRLTGGADVKVKLSVEDTMAVLNAAERDVDFVTMPVADGTAHVRASGVIVVFDDAERQTAGFRRGSL